MARPHITRPLAVPSLARAAAWAADQVRDQADRLTLWAPLVLGGGAATYFALRVEPPLWPLLALSLGFALSLMALRRSGAPQGWRLLLVALTLFTLGATAAKVRTLRVAGPVLSATRPCRIEGWVVDLASPGTTGGRVVLAPVRIGGLDPDQTPRRVRVTLPPGVLPRPGDPVVLTAILGPPPSPASPGAYDFARDAWFDGIGGVGFTRATPVLTDLPPATNRLALLLRINRLRWRLAEDIARIAGPEAAGLAAAMTTGHEAFLRDSDQTALRNAGLAHIISISGLHMAIVGGFVFFALRGLIALLPPVALRVSGKKIAAVGALAAVLAYLLLSGAPSPAQRAAMTAGVALVAILFDRRAVTLHTLALAAMLILLMQPEAVVDPGFQMSFAATAALVALAEAWPRPVREISAPWPIRAVQGALTWLGVSLGASLVAGLATGPIAMQAFNRVAVYGLAANLVSEPLSTFVIMPALALGAAGQPFGVGAPFLQVAAFGIRQQNALAAWFSALPGAVWLSPSAPDIALPLAFVGSLFLCLWKGPLRWLGLPFALSVALWPRPTPPDAWIADDGAAAAIRDGGRALALRPDARAFAADLWARRRGLVLEDGSSRFDCNRRRCRVAGQVPVRLAGWWTRRRISPAAMADLCTGAEIVVVRADAPPSPPNCAHVLVLSGADFVQGGSAEVFRRPGGWRVVWAEPIRGRRPWTGQTAR